MVQRPFSDFQSSLSSGSTSVTACGKLYLNNVISPISCSPESINPNGVLKVVPPIL